MGEVPPRPANNAAQAVAESVEERHPAKENTASKTRPGHRAGSARQVRWPSCVKWHKEISKHGFTALLHHVSVDRLRAAFWAIRPKPRQELTV